MTSEIDAIRALLSSAPRPVGWTERRRRIAQVCAVDPLPAGVTAQTVTIGTCAAEWLEPSGAEPDRAVLYLHGGGYCSGSITSHRSIAGGIARAAGVRVLLLDYRLAPEHPFPAALEDATAAWADLLAQGFSPGRLALAGDSAGGGLVLALLQRLRDAGAALPGCAWLFSPWVDLTMSGASMTDRDAADPLVHGPYLHELAEAYLAGHDPRDPLVSPLFADLAGLPPVLIQVGADETLLDDSVRLARALGAQQVMATLQVWPHMIHVFPIWAARLAEGRRALAAGAAFLAANLG